MNFKADISFKPVSLRTTKEVRDAYSVTLTLTWERENGEVRKHNLAFILERNALVISYGR